MPENIDVIESITAIDQEILNRVIDALALLVPYSSQECKRSLYHPHLGRYQWRIDGIVKRLFKLAEALGVTDEPGVDMASVEVPHAPREERESPGVGVGPLQ